jgi:tetratricopeptide (TPR) repeat protein
MQLGYMYYRTKNNKAVETLLRNALKDNPNNMLLNYSLIIWLLSGANYQDAEALLKNLISNSNVEIEDHLKANINALLGKCYVEQERFKKAKELLYNSKQQVPWDLDVLKGFIDLYISTGRGNQIPEVIKDYLNHYGKIYAPCYWMANYYHFYLYRPKLALGWYKLAVDDLTNQDHRRICNNYYSSKNIIDDLIDDYSKCLIETKQAEVADKFMKTFVFDNLDILNIDYRMIKYFILINDFAAAERIALSKLKNMKKDSELWALLALAQLKEGKMEDAFCNITQALSIKPDSLLALDILASIQKKKNLWESAKTTYLKILTMAPHTSVWMSELGDCYLHLGKMDKAIEIFRKAIKLDPLNPKIIASLEKIY